MKKIKNWMLEHKGLAIVIALAFIIVVVVLGMFLSMFVGGSKNNYGSRLEGIEKVKINNSKMDEIKNSVKENEAVSNIDVRVQGKIVYISINFNEGTSKDDAKKIASSSLENFSEDELKYYDISYFLVEDKAEDGYVITGNKHPKHEEIGWSLN